MLDLIKYPIFRLLPLFIAVTCLFSCKDSSDKTTGKIKQDEETAQMAAELKALQTEGQIIEMWHQNEARALYYEKLAKETQDVSKRFSMVFKAAIEWLNAGDYDRSIKLFTQVIEQHENGSFRINDSSLKQFYELLAVSYLRKAEIENCVMHHNSSSCLMPINEEGRHRNRAGSEKALEIYNILLKKNPSDLQNIWLYNLAQMTLGNYPDKINPEFRLPPRIFESDTSLYRFKDVAMQAGVAVNNISGSCIVDDFNNDGLLDIVASSYDLDDQLHYFINEGNGNFNDMTHASGLDGIVSGLNLVQADYNNDGFLDFLILRGAWLGEAGQHPNSLIKNNGDGSFSDVTKSSGIYSLHPTQTACWGDVNNDGLLDLFIGNESSGKNMHSSELYINNGNGSFSESAQDFGLDIQLFVKGCRFGDTDNDGDIDLYVSNLTGANRFYENTGKSGGYRFRDITAVSGVANPMFSFPCWFWDVNNDGLLDLYVNSFDVRDFTTASGKVAADYLGLDAKTELSRLYINKGNNKFDDATKAYGLDKVLYTMGCNFEDINNDGYLDFYAATGTPDFRAVFPNRMFLNQDGKRFLDVTSTTETGHIQKGHGVGFGDIDNDGDQDMYVVLGGSYAGDNFMNALFENPGEEDHNWVSLTLTGQESNRSAIGAKIIIRATNDEGKERTIHRTVGSGASFGCNSLRQEIGLGAYSRISSCEIIWPGETMALTIENVAVNKHYTFRQGSSQVERVEYKKFRF